MIAFYNQMTSCSIWHECYLPLPRLVHKIVNSPLAAEFRAGQSVLDLIISTKPEHGLAFDDPYIRVGAGVGVPMLDVGYWLGMDTRDLVEKHTVGEDQVLETLTSLLARLRAETKVADDPDE